MKKTSTYFILLMAVLLVFSCKPKSSFKTQSDGIQMNIGEAVLSVTVCADNIIRVNYLASDTVKQNPSIVVTAPKWKKPEWKAEEKDGFVTITTAKMVAKVNQKTGDVAFYDLQGNLLTKEADGGRIVKPITRVGMPTFEAQQIFETTPDEAFYGLGAHQTGLMNYKGYDVDMYQHNIVDIIPVLVSSKGYGILWDNCSHSKFGDPKNMEIVDSKYLFDKNGQAGSLTGEYYEGRNFEKFIKDFSDNTLNFKFDINAGNPIHEGITNPAMSVRWTGEIQPDKAGEYMIATYNNEHVKLWIDDELIIDYERQNWLPWYNYAKFKTEANQKHKIKIEWRKNSTVGSMKLSWKHIDLDYNKYFSLWSQAGSGIDYYFMYGPEIDKVVAAYRETTGQAPMMPQWAYGLWQCRERYKSADEMVNTFTEFRKRGIPLDNIVLDWQYWKIDEWGSHNFDSTRFPDPKAFTDKIHNELNGHVMISVWPKFYTTTDNFKALNDKGWIYQACLRKEAKDFLNYPYSYYDAYNPEARKLYWDQINQKIFSKGFDAWWLDGTEPELIEHAPVEEQEENIHPTFLGSGAEYLNAYSLVNSQAVYDGQRSVNPDQRVFILTRSAFSGQQRYAAATWSGDIFSAWKVYRDQIPAGMNFCLSGIPYWTTDIGGFSNSFKENDEEWFELFTRWFQYGTFCPLFRVHGQVPYREMWLFGDTKHKAYQTQLAFDKLRYRLMPYIYSLGGMTTHEHYTIMRALVMDFQSDAKTYNIADQFMFGPALMVNPVYEYKAVKRQVYLPKSNGWYDFWTGKFYEGGQEIEADAPYERLPLFIKAGSIVPFGPEIQYVAEKPADPLEIRVYPGADGSFTLYEDEGINYNYEKGMFATITFRWDNAQKQLIISSRTGQFAGMLEKRTFNISIVSENKASGYSIIATPDKSVEYTGAEMVVQF